MTNQTHLLFETESSTVSYCHYGITSDTRSRHPERASAFDFKDAATRHLVIAMYLSIYSNEHQNVPLVNHQLKCLINGICGILDMKSNCFGRIIPKKLKKLRNWIKVRLNAKNVFIY